MTLTKNQRLPLLDAFRCLAILFVMFYHYTSRYINEDMYPYKDFYGSLFKYGRLGVSFFFIISGFVISFTLENTKGRAAFFKSRFIRLFPPMLLCSVITFCFFLLFDTAHIFPEPHSTGNFLLSLTFVPPYILGRFLHQPLDWLNGSYWSLWVEVQFYVVSCLFFFKNQQKYFINMLLFAAIVASVSLISLIIYYPGTHFGNLSVQTKSAISFWVHDVFSLSSKIQYFAVGIWFFRLYTGDKIQNRFTRWLIVIACLFCLITCRSVTEVALHLLMGLLFWSMIYKPKLSAFLLHPLLVRIGVLSYSIYLIHESIGIFILKQYSGLMGRWSAAAPFVLLLLIVLFAEASYRLYEKPVMRLLKKLLFKKDQPADTVPAANHAGAIMMGSQTIAS